MSKTELLKSIYNDVSNPASFGSVDKLYREAKQKNRDIKRKDVEKFLSGVIPYTLHRKIVRRFPRNPVVAQFHSDQAQADLVEVIRYADDNDGNNYILTIIDVFSKYAYAIPIKRKSGKLVAAALETVLKSYWPSKLQTDGGKEFTNKEVQSLLQNYWIHYFIATNERIKCAVVERFQRTLMSRVHKYFTAYGTHRYMDVLSDIITAYNNCYHRSIKMTPLQATTVDRSVVFRNLYGVRSKRDLLKRESKTNVNSGEYVRIPEQKNPFHKGYLQNFTDEIYRVSNVNTSAQVPVYSIENYKGEKMKGNFYRQEIQSVENENKYRVQVLDERKRGRGKQYLIKYINFPEYPAEWIPGSRLLDVNG